MDKSRSLCFWLFVLMVLSSGSSHSWLVILFSCLWDFSSL
jgi:hypothetical protein